MDDERLIRERAYTIWEQDGRPEGRHAEHWQQAEQEIDPAGQRTSAAASAEAAQPGINPGDEAVPGTPGTGEDV